MKKIILLLIIVLNYSAGRGQDSLTFTDHNAYKNFIFGNLSTTTIPTGFLLDKNGLLTETDWQKFVLNDNNEIETFLTINDWFELYKYLKFSKTNDSNLVEKDSLLWPLYHRMESQLDFDEVTLPIFILDFEVNKFKPNAVENGNILFENNQYSDGINPTEGILTKHLFAGAVLLDTIKIKNVSINLSFEDIFVLSNRDKNVDFITCNLNGKTFTLYENESFDITPIITSKNNLQIQLHYSDGETLSANFRFYQSNEVSTKTLDETSFFDEVDYIGPGFSNAHPENPRLRYCIKYACGNTQIRKPVFFVSGFNVSSHNDLITLTQQADCKELYDKYNIDGLMDELRLTGHDVIMVRFTPAVAYLNKNADKLIELINLINNRKAQNNSTFENIIVGYSSGAIVTRFALDKMEHDHINNNGPHPHTKLYVSFEGEQQGANITLGIQCLTQHLNDNGGGITISVINYMANSPTAKQLLIYYKGEDYNTQNAGQSPDQLRTDFLNDMNNTYAHQKQTEKYGYGGYPAFSRMVVIANGNRETENIIPPTGLFTAPIYRNTLPYYFYPGHTIFKQTNTHKRWKVDLSDNSHLYGGIGNIGNQLAFLYEEENIWGNVTLTQNYYTDHHLLLYDYSPGGFLLGDSDLNWKVLNKAYSGNTISGQPDNDGGEPQYRQISFTPTVSVLDIRNFTPTHYQLHYDLWENNLMMFDFTYVNDNFYGYPHLGHPTNHFSITPFEAIYCDNSNQTHIESSAATSITQNGTVVSTSPYYQPFINDFLFTEIMYKKLYLQNQQVGWNTNGSTYAAEYETQESITIGEQVTPQTDVAPYEILENGSIKCKAGETISLKPGFHAHQGSVFHGHIQNPPCLYLSGGPSARLDPSVNGGAYKNTESTSGALLTNEEIESQNYAFVIVPNPSQGQFNLRFTTLPNSFNVKIFDLSGKMVYLDANTTEFNLDLEKGVYIVYVETSTQQYQQKLIIQ